MVVAHKPCVWILVAISDLVQLQLSLAVLLIVLLKLWSHTNSNNFVVLLAKTGLPSALNVSTLMCVQLDAQLAGLCAVTAASVTTL